MDGEHVRRTGRDRGGGGEPDDVGAAHQAGQRRAPGHRRRREEGAPGEAVAHERHARVDRGDRCAAGDEGEPLVLGEAVGQRRQQLAREARHAAPGEQCARVDTHLHRHRTV